MHPVCIILSLMESLSWIPWDCLRSGCSKAGLSSLWSMGCMQCNHYTPWTPTQLLLSPLLWLYKNPRTPGFLSLWIPLPHLGGGAVQYGTAHSAGRACTLGCLRGMVQQRLVSLGRGSEPGSTAQGEGGAERPLWHLVHQG